MDTITRITYRQPDKPVKGAVSVSKAMPELVGINPKSNNQRLAEYVAKRSVMEAAA